MPDQNASSLPAGTGIMVCGHGSRDERAVAEFAQVSERLRDRFPGVPVDYGYLEFARPIIRDGLDNLLAQGVKRILAVPGMLFAAGHARPEAERGIASLPTTCDALARLGHACPASP